MIATGVLAMLVGAAGQIVNPSRGLAWITTAGIPSIVVAVLLVTRGSRRALLALVCVLLYLEAVLTASLFTFGIAFAILVPIIGIGLIQNHVRGAASIAAYVAAGAVATISVALVEVGRPAGPLDDHDPVLTVVAFGLVAACTLGLLWRAGDQQASALDGAALEIAARVEAERALSDTSELLQTLIASSPVATIGLEVSGAVSVWNPAAERLFGWPSDDMLGRSLPQSIDPLGGRGGLRELVDRTLAGETIRGEQARARDRGGRELVVEVHADVRHDSHGNTLGVTVHVIDVTERATLQAQLQQAQKMEAVGHLAGGVAHDINNTLTAVGGFAELIEAEASEPEVKDDARTISDAVSRARQLTRQLLVFARRSVLHPEVVDVTQFVGSISPLVEQLLGDGIELRVHHGSAPVRVRVDPGQFEQALLNLAANARDAMPDGGTLTITTTRKMSDADAGTDRIPVWGVVTVSDTGAGIAPELHDQVFEPFFTTKPRERGGGLGLAMVYGFVTQSGGTVQLRSIPGAGTSVEIRLPATGDDPTPSAAGTEPARSADRETILFVEDEIAISELCRRLLTGLGYRVISATDGSTAIELARAHVERIDLIVSDVVMPGLSGPEVVQAIHSLHPEAAVLFASGYTADRITDRRLLPEGVELLEKPFSAAELAGRVRAVLDSRTPTGGPADEAAPNVSPIDP
ncbi:MAG TPA: ATP-binding protein [Candidatus Limnocylindria bacterium]|nr:ATP-binding protein [Candidatus Limnocylindria bacterium]